MVFGSLCGKMIGVSVVMCVGLSLSCMYRNGLVGFVCVMWLVIGRLVVVISICDLLIV